MKTIKGFFKKTKKEPWEEHWQGMPEYKCNRPRLPLKSITIHFKSEEDFEVFKSKINRDDISIKTKSIWFPKIKYPKCGFFVDEDLNERKL